jgi:hypothetical protein
VPGVQEAVELRAVPAHGDIEVRPQRHDHRPQLADPDAVEVTSLDPRHHGARHPGAGADVGLAKARPDADCPEASSDP